MPDCHKCHLDGQKSVECIACKGPSENPHNDGQCFVDIDAVQLASKVEALSETDREEVIEVMRVWLRMPATTRDALALRVTNPEISDAEVGRLLGISRAGVGIAVRRAEGRMIASDELTLGL